MRYFIVTIFEKIDHVLTAPYSIKALYCENISEDKLFHYVRVYFMLEIAYSMNP